MVYKNLSRTTKTFYGVTFQPGEAKEVSGNICHPDMITVADSYAVSETFAEPNDTIESVETVKSVESTEVPVTKRRRTSRKSETVNKTDDEIQIDLKEGVTENGADHD